MSGSAPEFPTAPRPFGQRDPADEPTPPPGWTVRRGLTAAAIGLLTVLVIGAASYTGFWFLTAQQTEVLVRNWATQQAAKGLSITWSGLTTSGFPFDLRATIDGPKVAGRDSAGPWHWTAQRLEMHAAPWEITRISAAITGPHQMIFGPEDQPVTLDGKTDTFGAMVALSGDGWPEQVAFDIERLSLTMAGAPELAAIGRLALKAQRNFPTPLSHESPTLDFRLEGERVMVPPGIRLPLGRDVEKLWVEGSLLGAMPAGQLPAPLAAWRDDGGSVEFTRLYLTHGPLKVSGNGTASVDDNLQPVGALALKIQGFFELVDALTDSGVVRDKDANLAKIVLGLLAKPSANGGAATLEIPVSVQNRTVYAGPVPVAALPGVVWSGRVPALGRP